MPRQISTIAVLLVVCGPGLAAAQHPAGGHERSASPQVPVAVAFAVHVRQAEGGALAGSAAGSRPGEFVFDALPAGRYVVELVDARGRVAGLSPAVRIAEGAHVTITVGPLAAGVLTSAPAEGPSARGRGTLAAVAISGEAGRSQVAQVAALREGRLLVCHALPGAPQTLEIRESSRQAHVRHGDSLGPCPSADALRAVSLQ